MSSATMTSKRRSSASASIRGPMHGRTRYLVILIDGAEAPAVAVDQIAARRDQIVNRAFVPAIARKPRVDAARGILVVFIGSAPAFVAARSMASFALRIRCASVLERKGMHREVPIGPSERDSCTPARHRGGYGLAHRAGQGRGGKPDESTGLAAASLARSGGVRAGAVRRCSQARADCGTRQAAAAVARQAGAEGSGVARRGRGLKAHEPMNPQSPPRRGRVFGRARHVNDKLAPYSKTR